MNRAGMTSEELAFAAAAPTAGWEAESVDWETLAGLDDEAEEMPVDDKRPKYRKKRSKKHKIEDSLIVPPWFPLFEHMALNGQHVLLSGPPGGGKTIAMQMYCDRNALKLYTLMGHGALTPQEVRGDRDLDIKDGQTVTKFTDSPLVRSLRDPLGVYDIDELGAAPADILMMVYNLISGTRKLEIPETGEVLAAHKNWRFFGATNPGAIGTAEISEALRSRLFILEVPRFDDRTEIMLLQKQFPHMKRTDVETIHAACGSVRYTKGEGKHSFDMCLRTMQQCCEAYDFTGNVFQAFCHVVLPKIGDASMMEGVRNGIREAVATQLGVDAKNYTPGSL